MRRLGFFLLLSFLSLSPLCLKAQDSLGGLLNLDQCIKYALNNNYDAQQYGLFVKRAEIAVQNSKNLFLPFVEGRLRNNYNYGLFIDPSTNIITTQNTQIWGSSVDGEMILFNGGYNYYNLKQSKEIHKASQEDQKAKNNEITLGVAMAYYQLLFAYEQERIANALKQQTEKQTALVNGMVERGILHKREMLQMESQLTLREVSVVDAQNTIIKSNFLLRQMMGIGEPVNLKIDSILSEQIPDTLALASYDSIYQKAFSFLPEISSAKSTLEARRYGIKLAQTLRYPSFSIAAGVLTKSSSLNQLEQSKQFRQNLSEYVTFNLRVPIFNRFQTTNAVSLTKVDAIIQEKQVKRVNLIIEQRVQSAYLDLITAHKKYWAVYKQSIALESQLKLSEKSYTNGIINFTDYSYSSNLYNNALIQLLQAKYDFFYKKKVLEFYEGRFQYR